MAYEFRAKIRSIQEDDDMADRFWQYTRVARPMISPAVAKMPASGKPVLASKERAVTVAPMLVLLAGSGSYSLIVELARLVAVPVFRTLALMVIVVCAPFARLPKWHTIGVVLSQVPWSGVILRVWSIAGIVSVTVTLVASSGPLLVTPMVKVIVWPTDG